MVDRAEASGSAELAGCAARLRRGHAAVAALTELWRDGQAESQVTRLKLQLFGRAKFDLLRRWGLHRTA